jgi:NAD(P)-dependent dehydrogenase (short-subunit alcohol dehydrogenase family)
MSTSASASILRDDLLAGAAIVLAHGASAGAPAQDSFAVAARARCAALGARLSDCTLALHESPEAEEAALEDALHGLLAELGAIDMLVVDAGSLFAARRAEASAAQERGALVGTLESCWNITKAVVNLAFLAGGRAGRILYIAPAPDAGDHAAAACAGLENLARTLSIEWARYAITPVTIAPGIHTSAGELAELTAYLASPAGAYFSGCLLDLRGPAAGR